MNLNQNSSEAPIFFTPKFQDFLIKHEIDKRIYEEGLKFRFIRIHPSLLPSEYSFEEDPFKDVDLSTFEKELSSKLLFIENSGGFCRIPASIPLSSTNSYKTGKIYGMDFSSGAAVLALGVEKGDQILELCCAPGAKLCFMSDLLAIKERGCDKQFRSGNITGVDIAEHRLFTCRSLIKKYKTAYRTRLFHADGTTFNVLPPTDLRFSQRAPKNLTVSKESISIQAASMDGTKSLETDIELKQVAPFYAPRHLRSPGRIWLPNSPCFIGYDKVLVDAECTHDGSIIHVLKYRLGKPIEIQDVEDKFSSEVICAKMFNLDKFDSTVLDDSRMAVLSSLQLDLLQQGYRLLSPGGTLVYSTCSLTIDQNEAVIARFIHAQIENFSFPVVESPSSFLPSSIPAANPKYLTTAILESHGIAIEHHEYIRKCVSQAIRYDPIVSETSGLFIARVRKPHLTGDKIVSSA